LRRKLPLVALTVPLDPVMITANAALKGLADKKYFHWRRTWN
jgi:hypothetical protein